VNDAAEICKGAHMTEKKPPREMSIEKAARLYFGQARPNTREEREGEENARQRKTISLAPVSIQKSGED
jgi:hypothetical protein